MIQAECNIETPAGHRPLARWPGRQDVDIPSRPGGAWAGARCIVEVLASSSELRSYHVADHAAGRRPFVPAGPRWSIASI